MQWVTEWAKLATTYREHQGRHRWNIPGDRSETRAALPRRVRISLQPAIRSRRHDAATSLGRRPHHAHAIPVAQAGRRLCLIRTTIIQENRLRKVRKQEQLYQEWIHAEQSGQYQNATVTILNVSRVDHGME